ncbi:PLP-dependent transferase [Myriangium duriaei CBS 260.36]|uniref:PLP-dependent transferase n=1 Tax=Myriangium duriaei CBS 260.36 TaxID=1168546 RepID=A0A9P4MJ07_9PEZI|nr:PLP-dependent transferase [Myriangium duriaei CBS 260.36]
MINGSLQSSVLHPTLAYAPPVVVKSDGLFHHTQDGRQILDATGGAAVASVGHNHPRVKEAIIKQLDDVSYCYAQTFTTKSSEALTKLLTESTGGRMSKVFIVSSGTEAVEAALKLSRQYHTENSENQRVRFIARRQSYHGNTLGSLSVSSHTARKALYLPMLSTNVSHVSPCYPYRNMRPDETEGEHVARLAAELEEEFQRVGSATVCAFVVETVSGATLGAVAPLPGYMKAMKQVCERHGALFIMDEVMSGIGRTGTFHAWEQEEVVPDIQTVAKGLGGGYVPIGAVLVNQKVVDVLSKGSKMFSHSQTYQAHPLACAAALAVQEVIRDEKLVDNVRKLGCSFGKMLKERLDAHPNIGEVRGRGFLWAVEFVQDKCSKAPFPVSEKVAMGIHSLGLNKKHCVSLLPSSGTANGKDGDHVVLAPPYACTLQDLEDISDRTSRVIYEFFESRTR